MDRRGNLKQYNSETKLVCKCTHVVTITKIQFLRFQKIWLIFDFPKSWHFMKAYSSLGTIFRLCTSSFTHYFCVRSFKSQKREDFNKKLTQNSYEVVVKIAKSSVSWSCLDEFDHCFILRINCVISEHLFV